MLTTELLQLRPMHITYQLSFSCTKTILWGIRSHRIAKTGLHGHHELQEIMLPGRTVPLDKLGVLLDMD